ncbi:hypothetical protein EGW08_001736 [Elysia chlorotica]|uniref:Uncharacterized protein n=1 Tax=Elysia chlorotica TaxID=188477 RepID=A0A3S1AFG5_ELYCH|nr:hypothetical protein EGW08_001736 [Elysia chlorotica]
MVYLSSSSPAKSVLFNVAMRFSRGQPLHVALTLPEGRPQVTTVRAALIALTNGTVEIVAAETSIEPGDTELLKLQVPWILPLADQYSILVYATSGESFATFRKVSLESSYKTALVQTDRKIYKPGQRVLFRVIHLKKGFTLSKDPVTVTIIDPNDIKIEIYRNLEPQNVWPTFEVDIRAEPGYIVHGSPDTLPSISVQASYTFGKGVQGVCQLQIAQKDQALVISIEEELSESGVVEFPSTLLSSFKSNSDLTLTAIVTDIAGRTENKSMVVKSFSSHVKIQFLPRTTTTLKPGLPAIVVVRVTDQQERPLGIDSELKVEIKATGIQTLVRYVALPAGETTAFLQYTPTGQTSSKEGSGAITVQLLQQSSVQKELRVFVAKDQEEGIVVLMEPNAPVDVLVFDVVLLLLTSSTY